MSKNITVTVGDIELQFAVSNSDFNQYINEQMPNDKVNPAFNFLSRTVTDAIDFQSVALVDGEPNGLVVMQIVGEVAGEFGGGVSVSLKKPKASPTASNATA